MDGRLTFQLSEPAPPLPGLKLKVTPDSLPLNSLPDKLALELTLEGDPEILNSAEPFTTYLNVRWELQLPEDTKPDSADLGTGHRPFVDYGGHQYFPLTVTVLPYQQVVRVRSTHTLGAGYLSGGTLQLNLADVERSGPVAPFEADFSDAGVNSRLTVSAIASPEASLHFDEGKSRLELGPSEANRIVPFWLSASAARGQTDAKVSLALRPLPSHVNLSPTQIVVTVVFRASSVSVTFSDTNAIPISVPATLDWGELMEHRVAKGIQTRMRGDTFELKIPPECAPGDGVSLSLSTEAQRAFEVVQLLGNAQEVCRNGGTINRSGSFRIQIKKDIAPQGKVDEFRGELLISPAGVGFFVE